MKQTEKVTIAAVLLAVTLSAACSSNHDSTNAKPFSSEMPAGAAQNDTNGFANAGILNKAMVGGNSYADTPIEEDLDDSFEDSEDSFDGESADIDSGDNSEESGESGVLGTQIGSANANEKIIYSASAEVETLDFEKTLSDVDLLAKKYGAFLQSSNVNGNRVGSYYSGEDYDNAYVYKPRSPVSNRRANIVLRVPSKSFSAMNGELATLGNLASSSTNAQNVTASFYDSESRLKTYREEEGRLLELLSRAESVEVIIQLESRLSDVRYQIERLTTYLEQIRRDVEYSTLTLSITEVAVYTPQQQTPPRIPTFGERIKEVFSDSWQSVKNFVKGVILAVISVIPSLVILVPVALIIFVIVRKRIKAKRKRLEKNKPEEEKTNEEQK